MLECAEAGSFNPRSECERKTMAERRENSVLFSLRELRQIEDQRVRTEEEDVKKREEDARAAREAAEHARLAAENYWDHVFFERTRDGSFPTYRGGPAFLFEIPTEELPLRFEENLFQLTMKGFLPVLAHPERYAPFVTRPEKLEKLASSCALVVDLPALAGHHGARATKQSRKLVLDGLAHAAASDVHSPSDVRAAAEGIAWIRKKVGDAAARRLLDDNPRLILSGRLPA